MNAVVVGADTLGNIPSLLSGYGIAIRQHISGRNAAHQRRPASLPRDTGLLILFTDFLGHNVMKQFRGLAQQNGVPVLACRRSVSCLSQSVESFLQRCDRDCANCPCKGRKQGGPGQGTPE